MFQCVNLSLTDDGTQHGADNYYFNFFLNSLSHSLGILFCDILFRNPCGCARHLVIYPFHVTQLLRSRPINLSFSQGLGREGRNRNNVSLFIETVGFSRMFCFHRVPFNFLKNLIFWFFIV